MENSRYCNTMRIIAMILLLLVAIDQFYISVYSIWDVLIMVLEYYTFIDYFTSFSPMIVTMMAIFYLWFAKPKDLSKILTICVLVIAHTSIIDAYMMLVEYRELVQEDELYKVVFFLEGVLNLVVSLMLIVNAFLYSRGLSKSTALIKYSVFILLGVMLLMMIIDFRQGSSIKDILTDYRDVLPLALLLAFVLMIINSKSVKLKTTTFTITTSIGDLRNSLAAMGIGIDRDIALRLSEYNDKGLWCNSYSFVLTTFYKEDYMMTLDKSGDDVLARISSLDNHTGVNNFRFHVRGLWSDTGDFRTCDLMRFYGEDGMFIQLIVRDHQARSSARVPKIGSIVLSSREPDTMSHRTFAKIAAIMSVLKEGIGRFKAFIVTNTIGRLSKKKE